MSLFSDRLRKLRDNKKKENSSWTQEYVADKLGVARVTYTAYENGTKQPPMETVSNIANLFETTTDFLYGRESKEGDNLNENDRDIINSIKMLPDHQKAAVKALVDSMAEKNKG